MIELCTTHFAPRTPKHITIANRTLERGEKLATRFGAEHMRLADLPERAARVRRRHQLHRQQPAHHRPGRRRARAEERRHRPIFMVDLAVPRDIEPEVKRLEDVYLYTVDDLASVVQTAQANRQAAVAQAEAIIDAGVQSFVHWMEQRPAAKAAWCR